MKNATLSGSMPGRNVIGRFVENNRKTIVEVIAALVILLFVYTSISKFQDFISFKLVLKESPLLGSMNVFVAWAIPITELLVSALLLVPRTRLLGLIGSLILMTSFTLYLGYMLLFTPKLPCSCGGAIKNLTWTQHFMFNIFFTLFILIGLLLSKKIFKSTKSLL